VHLFPLSRPDSHRYLHIHRELFKKNQIPYLEVRRPFILGVLSEDEPAWKPTAAHMFMKVLHDKGLLRCAFTQNIDGLDYHTGLPADAICPVHGSIGKVACEMCGKECGNKWFHDQVVENIKDIYAKDPANSLPTKSTKIACPSCGKFGVKPATVLYGRDLPAEFFERKPKVLSGLDLLFVAGTSLVVGPANTIAEETEESTVRCLVNMEKVGEELGMFNAGREDVFCKADVDDTFIKLAELCGWLPDLADLTDGMASGSKAKVFESMARLSAHEPHRKKE
jgi:NAD-dependent SIR2 family protein deacetylase